MGSARVFDNAELGTEADVFLRASLILCPHTPFWSAVELSEQLIPLLTPFPCHHPPPLPLFYRPGLQPLLRTSIRGFSLPWQPFSSHSNLSNYGDGALGKRQEPTSNMWLALMVKSVKDWEENVNLVSLVELCVK